MRQLILFSVLLSVPAQALEPIEDQRWLGVSCGPDAWPAPADHALLAGWLTNFEPDQAPPGSIRHYWGQQSWTNVTFEGSTQHAEWLSIEPALSDVDLVLACFDAAEAAGLNPGAFDGFAVLHNDPSFPTRGWREPAASGHASAGMPVVAGSFDELLEDAPAPWGHRALNAPLVRGVGQAWGLPESAAAVFSTDLDSWGPVEVGPTTTDVMTFGDFAPPYPHQQQYTNAVRPPELNAATTWLAGWLEEDQVQRFSMFDREPWTRLAQTSPSGKALLLFEGPLESWALERRHETGEPTSLHDELLAWVLPPPNAPFDTMYNLHHADLAPGEDPALDPDGAIVPQGQSLELPGFVVDVPLHDAFGNPGVLTVHRVAHPLCEAQTSLDFAACHGALELRHLVYEYPDGEPSFLSTPDSCDWDALTCAGPPGDREVLRADLAGRGYAGPVPDAILGFPTILRLDWSDNDLTGPIPAFLGELGDLDLLDLSDNPGLDGEVPLELMETRLRRVVLDGTNACLPLDDPGFAAWWSDLHIAVPPDGGACRPTFSCDEQRDLPEAQCEALVALFDASGGPDWRQANAWLQAPSPCDWEGVGCAPRSGRFTVDALHLAGQGLTADGRDIEVFEALPDLLTLDLSRNASLVGPPPDTAFELRWLQRLFFSHTSFEGPVPDAIGQLRRLQVLGLSGAAFEGPMPDAFWGLNDLTDLWMFDLPGVVGPLPTSLQDAGHLTTLYWDADRQCVPDDPHFAQWLASVPFPDPVPADQQLCR